MSKNKDVKFELQKYDVPSEDKYLAYIAQELYKNHKQDLLNFYYMVIKKIYPYDRVGYNYIGELENIVISNDIVYGFQVSFNDMDRGRNSLVTARPYSIIPLSITDSDAHKATPKIEIEWQNLLINIFGDTYKHRLKKILKYDMDGRLQEINKEIEYHQYKLQNANKTKSALDEEFAEFNARFSDGNIV